MEILRAKNRNLFRCSKIPGQNPAIAALVRGNPGPVAFCYPFWTKLRAECIQFKPGCKCVRRRQTIKAVFAAAVILSLGPLVAVQFTLNTYADLRGKTEVEAAAQRYATRAERTLDEAINLLQKIDIRKNTTCLADVKTTLRRIVWKSDTIDFIGLVDENGFVMCGEPVALIQKGAVLPARTPESPVIEIGIEGDGGTMSRKPLVSWTLDGGVRLVARIKAENLNIDAGPDYLRRTRRVEVRLADGSLWYAVGGPMKAEKVQDATSGSKDDTQQDDTRIGVQIPSTKYPLVTSVSVARSAARSLVAPLEHGAIAAAVGFFLLASGIAFAVSYRQEDTTADEVAIGIKNREFVPFYQPVMDIDTGCVQGCEVLVRWIKPDGTVVSPGAFMQYAENSGAIFEITTQLMEKTVKEVGDLCKQYPHLKISINLFAGHFEDRKIIQDTEAIFGNSNISYEQLVFEVTERQPLRDMEMARKLIAEFHALGVRVALDDAGTGHGGLAYLQQLGIDIIKIDKMFIDALGTDHASSTIVDTLVELGGNLGMGIVAEGVETLQQIERLRELGVTAAQGFIFAPALPGDVFIELTKKLAPAQEEADDDDDAAENAADDEALFDETEEASDTATDVEDDFFDETADGEGGPASGADEESLENAA